MSDPNPAVCPDCSEACEATDNYCRRCGMYLVVTRELPMAVERGSQSLTMQRPGLPAQAKKVVTALAIGTALQVGVGLAGKYLAAQAARKALSAPATRGVGRKGGAAPRGDIREDADAVSETVLVRRVWIRRG